MLAFGCSSRYSMEGEKAMYTTKTDLINKLASGNETGWQEFENTYRGLIVSVALKHGVSVADTDDIMQVVMLALFNNGKFNYSREKHGKFRTYLGGIIRHKIADHFRKTKSVSPDGFSENEEYALPEFEAVYLAEYRQYILNAAIEDLKQSVSPEYFEAFQLCVLQDISDKQAAQLLGEKPNTVTIRKKRCREVLQRIILELNTNDHGLDLPFL